MLLGLLNASKTPNPSSYGMNRSQNIRVDNEVVKINYTIFFIIQRTKTKSKMKITKCKGYKKGKYDNICVNCNSNKSYCEYSRKRK